MAAGKPTKPRRFAVRLHKQAVIEFNQTILELSETELREMAEDPAGSAYRRITAKALVEAIEQGNLGVLGWIYDRTYGKPATNLTIDANINHRTEEIKSMSTRQVIQLIRETIPAIEGKHEKSQS